MSSRAADPPSFFEGPEKKLEIVVSSDHRDLRSYGDAWWNSVVQRCGGAILSKRTSPEFDAYVLSESSLFVYSDHATMITCGCTRLVDAALEIIEQVSVSNLDLLLYERKNEHFPVRQPADFYDDAQRLSKAIPGAALQFGAEDRHHVNLFHSTKSFVPSTTDTTIEILMHGIPERVAKHFMGRGRRSDNALAAQLGFCDILPGFDLDEYVFQPAGYSVNALKEDLYYAIHVTPEALGSYVSFETNIDFRESPTSLVRDITRIFDPESFDVFSFAPHPYDLRMTFSEYILLNHTHHEVCGYDVAFHEFVRPQGQRTQAKRLVL